MILRRGKEKVIIKKEQGEGGTEKEEGVAHQAYH
jgi:hypothetical protein